MSFISPDLFYHITSIYRFYLFDNMMTRSILILFNIWKNIGGIHQVGIFWGDFFDEDPPGGNLIQEKSPGNSSGWIH